MTTKKTRNYGLKLLPNSQDMSKTWYVELVYTDPATFESCRKQFRGYINSFKKKSDRIKEAKALIEALALKIELGWNPISDTIAKKPADNLGDMPFNKALDFAMDSKIPNLEKKSISDIGGVKKFAQEAAIKIGIHLQKISETKRTHIKLLLEQIGKDRQKAYDKQKRGQKWTGNSYNKYKRFLQILFTELEEFEAIEFNPCSKISKRPEYTMNLHRHATDAEMEIIKKELKKVNFNFFVFLAAEYLTGIRPKELFGLQASDIDWLNQCFDIKATEGKSKTRKARRVPIPNTLLKYLDHLNIKESSPSNYIFSEDFRPGPERQHRDIATKLWKKIVKDGLGLNISLYSFKGKGGEGKRRAGIDASFVSAQYGHSSMGMTMRYLHGEQDRINQEIIEKTPDF